VWYIATMTIQRTVKVRAVSVSFNERGELMGNARVFIYNTPIGYRMPVHYLPDYMRERIALMKLRHGEYPAGIADKLRSDMGVWIGQSHLLIGLTRSEYKQLSLMAKAMADANTRGKGKDGDKEDTGQAQRLLFFTDNRWVRAFWRP
jgi:hypothetical protein